jgi:membrane associated rhomboid family serine protease
MADSDPGGDFWKALNRATPAVFVTPTIMLLNALVFVLMLATGVSLMEPNSASLVQWGADFGPLTTNGEWWRMIASAFVHIGPIHILMNMWVLYDIGKFTERLFGHLGFTVMYMLAALGSSLCSLYWHPQIVSAGASGAIFGLYGGLLAFLLLQRHTIPAETLKSLTNSTGTFVVYNVIFGYVSQGTDVAAHAGGLLTGFFVGLLLTQSLHRVTFWNRAGRATAALILGSMALVAGAAHISGAWSEAPRLETASDDSPHTALGELHGTLTNASGIAVAGATITVADDNHPTRSVSSGDDGQYTIESLPASNYSVKFTAPGFNELTVSSVEVEPNRSVTLDRQLRSVADGPSAGEDGASAAIRAVLRRDEEIGVNANDLTDKISGQEPSEAVSTITQLATAALSYVADARNIDLNSCPGDFGRAYLAYLSAWADLAKVASSLSESGQPWDWQNLSGRLDGVREAWKAVEQSAVNYGVQFESN